MSEQRGEPMTVIDLARIASRLATAWRVVAAVVLGAAIAGYSGAYAFNIVRPPGHVGVGAVEIGSRAGSILVHPALIRRDLQSGAYSTNVPLPPDRWKLERARIIVDPPSVRIVVRSPSPDEARTAVMSLVNAIVERHRTSSPPADGAPRPEEVAGERISLARARLAHAERLAGEVAERFHEFEAERAVRVDRLRRRLEALRSLEGSLPPPTTAVGAIEARLALQRDIGSFEQQIDAARAERRSSEESKLLRAREAVLEAKSQLLQLEKAASRSLPSDAAVDKFTAPLGAVQVTREMPELRPDVAALVAAVLGALAVVALASWRERTAPAGL
jgi:hypothetical protein